MVPHERVGYPYRKAYGIPAQHTGNDVFLRHGHDLALRVKQLVTDGILLGIQQDTLHDDIERHITVTAVHRSLGKQVVYPYRGLRQHPGPPPPAFRIAAAPFADTAGRRSLADDDRNRIVILPDEIGDIELRAPHTRLTVSGRLAVYLDAERGGDILHTQQDGPVVPRITDLEPGRIADSFRHTVALPLLQRNHIGGCTARQRLFA